MKKLFPLLVLCMVTVVAFGQKVPESRTKTAVASYNGSSTGAYFFTNNANEAELKFKHVEASVLKTYNLNDPSLLGKYFRVTYRIDFLKNEEKKNPGKLAATQSDFKKQLTIIALEELPDFQEEDEDDDGNRR